MKKNRAIKAMEREIRRSQIRGLLMYLAHVKQTIDYVTISAVFGMFSGGSELAGILGEIQEEDFEAGEPLKSSLVIGINTKRPGAGYFAHAREKLKIHIEKGPLDEYQFWAKQMHALGVPVPEQID